MYIRAQIAHETFWRQQKKKQTQDKQRKMNKMKKKTSAKQKRDRTKIKITKTCPLKWVVNNKLI